MNIQTVMKVTIGQLAERLGAELVGQADDGDKPITAVRPIEAAGETDVTFVTGEKHKAALGRTHAGAIWSRRVKMHLENRN